MTVVAMGSPQPNIECRWCFSVVSQSGNRLGTNSYIFVLALKSAERSKSTATLLPGLIFLHVQRIHFLQQRSLVTCNVLYTGLITSLFDVITVSTSA